jgi:tetratricopeptide (TPR) repeat protein
MKSVLLVVVLCLAAAARPSAAAAAERQVGDLGQVGTVRFPTSCDPALQAEFDRGVALLHSFFYDEARRVFTRLAERDPDCAMAHWGVAMTYYHPLWAAPDSTDLAAGGAAVQRALAAKEQNQRERSYVRAIEAFYKGLDEPLSAPEEGAPSCHGSGVMEHQGRAACFRREMEKVAAANPEDVDAGAFYALSLLGSAKPGDPGLVNQKQAAQVLEKWYAKYKHHPGLAHYLIHSYDYPPLATQGLAPARAYASIAPWVPHALHMPSHIFTRLGMWQETVESNLASAAASRRYAAEHHPDAASFEELHALDYALYGYLQTAQDGKARELIARLNSIDKTYPATDLAASYSFGAMPARFALERRQWKEAAELELRPMPFWSRMPFAEGHIVYARAVGAARSGDLAAAKAAAERLRELVANSTEPRFKYFAQQMDIQRDAALGLIAFAEGRKDEAIATLRRAAAREDSLGKHPVSPGAMLPVRELLAETLLDNGQGAEALTEFQASLKINPRRFNGVYGAARAAAAAGDKALVRKYYQELAALAKPGDPRPELAEARKLVAGR